VVVNNSFGSLPLLATNLSPCSFGLSATSQQYFSLRTNQPPATSQQYFSLRTNQHQPSATSQTNRLKIIQSAWNISTNKNPLLSAALKAKYYPDNTLWTASTTVLDLFIGPLFFTLNIIFTLMPFCKFTMAAPPYGLPLGLRIGKLYMIT
jgi:hypothetical protein